MNDTTHGNSILSKGDEDFFSTWAEEMGKAGYHLTKDMLHSQIDTYLMASEIAVDNDYFPISDDTLSRMLERNKLATTQTNRIDVGRAK